MKEKNKQKKKIDIKIQGESPLESIEKDSFNRLQFVQKLANAGFRSVWTKFILKRKQNQKQTL